MCEIRSDLSFYIFPKTIANIHGTVDLFNEMFTNPEYYADLKYGIEEVNYIILDKKTVPRDNLAGAYLNLKQISQMGDKQNSCYPGSIDILDTIPDKMWFEKNIFNDYHTYLADDREDEAHFGYGDSTVVDSLFNKYLSTDDAIDEYIKNFLKAGRKTFIESLNLRLGSATYYDYP